MKAQAQTQNADPRALAVRVLLRLDGDEPVQSALDACLRGRGPQERALCTELVYGYLRNEPRLEAVLDSLLKQRSRLPREMQLALGCAAYALLFLSRVPEHATVNTTVAFVRRRFGQGLSSVANGTLRSLQRLGDAPLHQEFYANLGRGDVFYSLPEWIVRLWRHAYGEEESRRLMLRAVQQPWNALRLNPAHAHFLPLHSALSSTEGACAVGAYGWAFAPGQTPKELLGKSMAHWHTGGALSWQAAGTQIAVAACLSAVPELADAPLWDACAGQGGKSLPLLEQGRAVGLCSDVNGRRLAQLRSTAARLGLPCPPLVRMNALTPALRHWKGNILLDAPCSGLGTLARRPEIRRRRTPEDVRDLVLLQQNMLLRTWTMLRQGGVLMYMTCTLNPEENEGQVRAFLQQAPSATLLWEWQTPHAHPWLEGMYVAVVQKNNPSP